MLGNRARLGVAFVILLAGCSGREPGGSEAGDARTAAPEEVVVAEFADRKLTAKDLEDYLNANLYLDEGVEGIPANDLAILQSRLFDSFVDEALLLHEAEQAGIQVSEEEVDAYMQANAAGEEIDDPKTEAALRDMARRDLTIQKLRGTWVEEAVKITPAEIAAYAEQHREDLEPERSLVLRSLMLASETEAKSVHASIAANKLTFDQAAKTRATNQTAVQPSKVTLDTLPDDVRRAIEGLGAGQLSEPVVVNGRPFLFYVESWVKPAGDVEETIRQRAEAGLRRQKQEDASRSQVDGARQRIPTRVHLDRLPFTYVPSG
jgi:parvulin-like peptidyl-prolyl isomerase